MAKETRTREELAQILMSEIRKYPECNHVVDVAITPPVQRAPDQCNWDAGWIVSGNQIACRHAWEIARQLQARFDLR